MQIEIIKYLIAMLYKGSCKKCEIIIKDDIACVF